jgi:hypothetical protein
MLRRVDRYTGKFKIKIDKAYHPRRLKSSLTKQLQTEIWVT